MLPLKTLSALLLLVLCSSSRLCAQQPAANNRFADPTSAKALDSLQKLNSRDYFIQSAPRFNSAASQRTIVSNRTAGQVRLLQTVKPIPMARNERTGSICFVISGRDFLMQDSLVFYGGEPVLTADGNVLLSGEFAGSSVLPASLGAFCMKTDVYGNVIWAKLFDSTAETNWDYLEYFYCAELHDGNIILAGHTSNKISGNDDLILTKLDNNGNIIWTRTYASRFWQGFHGSGDFFSFRGLQDDPVTGEIYFTGSHYAGMTTVTKVDAADGHVIWSTGYDTWGHDIPFGIIINPDKLFLFQLQFGSNNESYIDAIAINKTSGDTLYSKHCSQTGDLFGPRLYNTFSVIKLNNGHFRMSGPTTRYYEFPVYTGTVDLYHAGIIELDENLNFVKAWGYKNRIESNGGNTRVSLFPNGSGVFTMLDRISAYNGESQVCLFQDEQIYHQRKRLNYNEGILYQPPVLQLADGGYLDVKVMGDSTALNSTRIDYYRIHTSDTASVCLGMKDSSTSTWRFDFEPVYRGMDSVRRNVFSLSRVKNFDTWNFTTHRQPACVITSGCDSLDIIASATTVCPGSNITVTIHKNKECGSIVPLSYDTSFANPVTRINDTTYLFHFNQTGAGYISGSLMGCTLMKDSVYIQVVPARNSLNIGNDTVLCPGNHITLNAGSGFTSYVWQDGSGDTTYTVTAPGTYYLTATNSCGVSYTDTVHVAPHPPIPISIGPDRFKCNDDTLRLTAPPGFISYTWSPGYNINSLTGQEVVVNPSQDTIYIVAAEKTPGCFAFDTVRITVKTSPLIYLGGDTSICRGDSLTLNAGNGFQTYLWNTGSTQQQVNINQPGIYTVKATTIDGCSSYDTLRLIGLFNLPQLDLGPDSVICNNHPRILGPAVQYTNYLWNTGAVTRTITVNTAGQYWLAVTDANGCKGADTTLIPSVEVAPTAFLGADTSICSFEKIVLQSSGAFDHYLWNTGSALSSITVTQPGSYWLQVVDRNSCVGKDTVLVIPKQCMEGLYVPSAFTPNNDGLNDQLVPFLFGEAKSFRFQIFNRWGEIVFQTTIPGKGWDGNYKGQKQDSNVFVWICNYQLNGKQPTMEKGKIVLIR